jgi:hypothetical protein
MALSEGYDSAGGYKRDPVHTRLRSDMIWVRESIRLRGGDDRRREYGC